MTAGHMKKGESDRISRQSKKKKKVLLKVVLILLLLAVVTAGGGLAALCISEAYYEHNSDLTRGDVIITLGSQVYPDGRLSPNLQCRLETTLRAWNVRHRTIVVCGGKGVDEPVEEARAMQKWLIENDVPAECILVDDTSFDTMENITHAKELMLSAGIAADSVLIVTSDFHVSRGVTIAKHFGFDAYGASAYTRPEYWVKYHAREMLAWVKWEIYAVFGWKIDLTWK